MSHPDPNGPPDLTPIQIGEVFENPVTGERATILERPWTNPERRVVAELTALVGARVAGEHRHPSSVERFTALEGELTVTRDGRTSILQEGEEAVVEPGAWHDWWNAGDRDARQCSRNRCLARWTAWMPDHGRGGEQIERTRRNS